jgi:DNA-binding transcriptional regulator YhcF (GntR family)
MPSPPPSPPSTAPSTAPAPASPAADLDRLDLSLDLVLDRHAEVPIGVQLAWALRARIRDGFFAPGQRLPGLRDLATALHINANTVRAVYQRLEHEGVLVSRQGSGTFVAEDTPSQALAAAGTIAARAARAALATGVDPREVAAALYVAPAASAAKSSARSSGALAARRRQLRAQIAALQRTLGELEARHPALIPLPAQPTVPAGPRLLDVGELEQVQAQLITRLASLHGAIDRLAARASGSGGSAGAATPAGAPIPIPIPIPTATAAPKPASADSEGRKAAKAPGRRARSARARTAGSAAAKASTRSRPAPAGA